MIIFTPTLTLPRQGGGNFEVFGQLHGGILTIALPHPFFDALLNFQIQAVMQFPDLHIRSDPFTFSKEVFLHRLTIGENNAWLSVKSTITFCSNLRNKACM